MEGKGLDVDALIELKKKVIKDYDRFTKRLGNGYVDLYCMILHEIAFIETYQNLDSVDKIYEFLMNN